MNCSNFLLIMMLLSYSIPIIYVYLNYSEKNESVSSIIGSDKCQRYILAGMIIMGIFTILYELNRKCISSRISTISRISICGLLLGIYGVILIKEEKIVHYVFAGLVFISIMGFMFIHSWCNFPNDFLNLSLYTQILLLVVLVFSMIKDKGIFFCEAFLIINFAIYYLYLHNL